MLLIVFFVGTVIYLLSFIASREEGTTSPLLGIFYLVFVSVLVSLLLQPVIAEMPHLAKSAHWRNIAWVFGIFALVLVCTGIAWRDNSHLAAGASLMALTGAFTAPMASKLNTLVWMAAAVSLALYVFLSVREWLIHAWPIGKTPSPRGEPNPQ